MGDAYVFHEGSLGGHGAGRAELAAVGDVRGALVLAQGGGVLEGLGAVRAGERPGAEAGLPRGRRRGRRGRGGRRGHRRCAARPTATLEMAHHSIAISKNF